MDGFSFYVCFGKWAGFYCELFPPAGIRIVAGYFAFAVGFWDLERDLKTLVEAAKSKEAPCSH